MAVSLYSPCPQSDFGKGPHWLHESPFLPVLWEQTQELGAPSLKHAAMKRVLSDQSLLKPELFAQVPWHIAEYLWECLGRCNKQTLHMWMIMAKVYPRHFRPLSSSYALYVERPKVPLKLYIDMMSSDVCKWRGILGLSSSYATITDLVAIGSMKNLVALEIFTSSPRDMKPECFDGDRDVGLDDRIVRSWVEAAESTGSLQELRVLRICCQENLTTRALRMLEKLPQLKLVVVYRCGAVYDELARSNSGKNDGVRVGGWIAQRLDWMLGDQDAKTVRFQRLVPLLSLYQHVLSDDNDHDNLGQGQGQQPRKQPLEEHEPSNLAIDSPVMQFELATGLFHKQDPDSPLSRIWNGFQEKHMIFFTRAQEPSRKKKREPPESVQSGKGKRIMKDRGGKDMADVLGDFL